MQTNLPTGRPVAVSIPVNRRLEMAYWLYWRVYELKILTSDFQTVFGADASLEAEFGHLFRPFVLMNLLERSPDGYRVTKPGAFLDSSSPKRIQPQLHQQALGDLSEDSLASGGIIVMLAREFNWLGYGFQTFILRKKIPYLFGLVITDKCNLNCFYCESKNSGRYHFTYEQAIEVTRDAYRRGHRALYFTGGEPMIWKDQGHQLDELIAFARKIGFLEVFIFTNGAVPLIIKQCNYIVTIDGPRDVHNQIRADTYDLILSNVEHAVTKAVFASITFSKANAPYLEQFVREVDETKLFRGISFNLLTHWPDIVEKYGLSLEGRRELLDNLWRLKKKGYPIVLSYAAYQALRTNNWKRPIPQIELGTRDGVFTCCRDVDNPSVCQNCGYANCVEVSQILALKPTAMWQVLRMVGS